MRLLNKKRLSKLLLCSMVFLLIGMGKSGASTNTNIIVDGFLATNDPTSQDLETGLILRINGEEKIIGGNQMFTVNQPWENLTVTVVKHPSDPDLFCNVVKKKPTVTVGCVSFLYSVNSSNNRLYAYNFSPNYNILGSDDRKTQPGISLGGYARVFPDPTRGYLLIVKDNTIGAHRIEPISGLVSEAPISSLPSKHDLRSLNFAFSPDGRYFYATSLSGSISAGRIDDGKLTQFDPFSAGITSAGLQKQIGSMAIDAGGKFVYLTRDFRDDDDNSYYSILVSHGIDQNSGKFINEHAESDKIRSCKDYQSCHIVIDPAGVFVYFITKNGNVFIKEKVADPLIPDKEQEQHLEIGPIARVVHSPKSPFVYMMGYNNVLYCYTFAEGRLKKTDAVSFPRRNEGQNFYNTDIAVDRTGSIVFASGFPLSELYSAKVDSAGKFVSIYNFEVEPGDIAVTK